MGQGSNVTTLLSDSQREAVRNCLTTEAEFIKKPLPCYMDDELGKHLIKAVTLEHPTETTRVFRDMFKDAIRHFDHDRKFADMIDALDTLASDTSIGHEKVLEMVDNDVKHHLIHSVNDRQCYTYMVSELPEHVSERSQRMLVEKSGKKDYEELINSAVDMKLDDMGSDARALISRGIEEACSDSSDSVSSIEEIKSAIDEKPVMKAVYTKIAHNTGKLSTFVQKVMGEKFIGDHAIVTPFQLIESLDKAAKTRAEIDAMSPIRPNSKYLKRIGDILRSVIVLRSVEDQGNVGIDARLSAILRAILHSIHIMSTDPDNALFLSYAEDVAYAIDKRPVLRNDGLKILIKLATRIAGPLDGMSADDLSRLERALDGIISRIDISASLANVAEFMGGRHDETPLDNVLKLFFASLWAPKKALLVSKGIDDQDLVTRLCYEDEKFGHLNEGTSEDEKLAFILTMFPIEDEPVFDQIPESFGIKSRIHLRQLMRKAVDMWIQDHQTVVDSFKRSESDSEDKLIHESVGYPDRFLDSMRIRIVLSMDFNIEESTSYINQYSNIRQFVDFITRLEELELERAFDLGDGSYSDSNRRKILEKIYDIKRVFLEREIAEDGRQRSLVDKFKGILQARNTLGDMSAALSDFYTEFPAPNIVLGLNFDTWIKEEVRSYTMDMVRALIDTESPDHPVSLTEIRSKSLELQKACQYRREDTLFPDTSQVRMKREVICFTGILELSELIATKSPKSVFVLTSRGLKDRIHYVLAFDYFGRLESDDGDVVDAFIMMQMPAQDAFSFFLIETKPIRYRKLFTTAVDFLRDEWHSTPPHILDSRSTNSRHRINEFLSIRTTNSVIHKSALKQIMLKSVLQGSDRLQYRDFDVLVEDWESFEVLFDEMSISHYTSSKTKQVEVMLRFLQNTFHHEFIVGWISHYISILNQFKSEPPNLVSFDTHLQAFIRVLPGGPNDAIIGQLVSDLKNRVRPLVVLELIQEKLDGGGVMEAEDRTNHEAACGKLSRRRNNEKYIKLCVFMRQEIAEIDRRHLDSSSRGSVGSVNAHPQPTP